MKPIDEETLRAELEEAEALRKRELEEPLEEGKEGEEVDDGAEDGIEADEADIDDEIMGGTEEVASHSNAIAVEEA